MFKQKQLEKTHNSQYYHTVARRARKTNRQTKIGAHRINECINKNERNKKKLLFSCFQSLDVSNERHKKTVNDRQIVCTVHKRKH